MQQQLLRAIVTGGSKGLGLGIAQALAAEGWNLHLISRTMDNLIAAKQTLQEQYPLTNITIQSGDMSQPTTVDECISFFQKELSSIRVLVLNHGGPPAGNLLDFSEQEWHAAFDLLIGSVIRWCRAFVPIFRNHQHGRILIVGSSSMREPIQGLALSNVMRSGLVGFIRTAAREWAPFGITINGLAPGSFETDRIHHLLKIRAEKNQTSVEIEKQAALAKIPVQRFGKPMELGYLAAFLASERASYITGQTILCDGGTTLGLP
ncbi:MAG: SDR family oxidoreductase [bacterium]|nr:SDR family oxidoreductase [bacterium]